MPSLRTPLCDLLGTRLPIIQAPMAGGSCTPKLVSAATSAGVLGSFGFAYTQPDAMQREVEAVRAISAGPININLFVTATPGPIAPESQRAAIDAVSRYYIELGLPAPAPVLAPYAPDLDTQLDAVESIGPAVFTAHLGACSAARVKSMQRRGMRVGGSATGVAEALQLQSLGFDFIVAQGGEAGGHRGSFLREPNTSLTGTLALVRMIVAAVKIPVVAAGGIMDGAGIAAALALGAQGAQLGTAFLTCEESGASAVQKRRLLELTEDETLITSKFSGKPARGISNRYMREMNASDAPVLAFPAQNALTGKLRAASAQADNPDFVAMWAGQAAPLARALSVVDLVNRLEAETIEAIDRVSRMRT
jgi:nitronate monooxygenase